MMENVDEKKDGEVNGEHTGQILIQESFLFFNLYNVKILFLRYAVDLSICFAFDVFFFPILLPYLLHLPLLF